MTREEAKKYFYARLRAEGFEHREWLEDVDCTETYINRLSTFMRHVGWSIFADAGDGKLSMEDYVVVYDAIPPAYKNEELPTPDQLRVSLEQRCLNLYDMPKNKQERMGSIEFQRRERERAENDST